MLIQSRSDVAHVSYGFYIFMPWNKVTYWLMLFVCLVGITCVCSSFSRLSDCVLGEITSTKIYWHRWSDNRYIQRTYICRLTLNMYRTSVFLYGAELFSPLALNFFCFSQRPVCFYTIMCWILYFATRQGTASISDWTNDW